MKRRISQYIGFLFLAICMALSLAFLGIFLYSIISKGWEVLSLSFLFEAPRAGMTEGGIFPALAGTFWLTFLAILIALPLGLLCSIYLFSYAKAGPFLSLLKITINTLAGVPSIIFGLFGMALFVNMLSLDVSLISGALTLAVLSLPIVINASQEAFGGVPRDFIEAAYALGATKQQMISRVLIPTAAPNILTSAILVVGRVAGETAPIIFTAATFFNRRLPQALSDEVMALPYHIFALMTEGTHPEAQVPIAYGSAVVLLLVVLFISSLALIIRYKLRKKRLW